MLACNSSSASFLLTNGNSVSHRKQRFLKLLCYGYGSWVAEFVHILPVVMPMEELCFRPSTTVYNCHKF